MDKKSLVEFIYDTYEYMKLQDGYDTVNNEQNRIFMADLILLLDQRLNDFIVNDDFQYLLNKYDIQKEDEEEIEIEEEISDEDLNNMIKYYIDTFGEFKNEIDNINNKYIEVAPNGVIPVKIIIE